MTKFEIPFVNISSYFEPLDQKKIALSPMEHCYMTWKNPKLPRSHAHDLEKFILSNPKFKFHFFDDKAQETWMEINYAGTKILEIYKMATVPVIRADIFRYALIYRNGGIYFSINRLCKIPIENILSDDDFSISFSKVNYIRNTNQELIPNKFKNKSLVQYTVAGQPNNSMLDIAMNLISQRVDEFADIIYEKLNKAIWNFSGPNLLTDAYDILLNKTKKPSKAILGFDFNDSLWQPKNSHLRYLQSESYTSKRNLKIITRKSILD